MAAGGEELRAAAAVMMMTDLVGEGAEVAAATAWEQSLLR
jgi:hypothetical protein